jgi:hypothetical protein
MSGFDDSTSESAWGETFGDKEIEAFLDRVLRDPILPELSYHARQVRCRLARQREAGALLERVGVVGDE